ncbi:MAG: hypothetical protein F6K53_20395 [Moorea sp. SIO4A1]|uniref:hypothetical protein n=1 Tax=Moorena sp. SIO4A1 TaxID=2607835 RepID=UPI001450CD05|nr:hypothetical protein [Moorena sp. SIO4A1]NEQ59633.1 hypothetical protein [Moorena sp. SIO4A1]
MNYTTTIPDTDENRATALASLRKNYLILDSILTSGFHFVTITDEIIESVIGMTPETYLSSCGMPEDGAVEEYLDVATLRKIESKVLERITNR